MEWILIIALYLRGDAGGITMQAVTFATEELCRSAGKTMAAEWSRGAISFVDQSRFVCVPNTRK